MTGGIGVGILMAVANRKGGVGKSTVTTMLAHGFAAIGEQRVLVVDLDTQCNSSIILTGGERWDAARRARRTIADYFDQKYDRPKLRPDDFIINKAGDIEVPAAAFPCFRARSTWRKSKTPSCTTVPRPAKTSKPPNKASSRASTTC